MKKIIIIILLVLNLTSKLYASAVYVPLADVFNYNNGDYIVLNTNGDIDTFVVSSMDVNNGLLVLDFVDNAKVGGFSGLNAYRVADDTSPTSRGYNIDHSRFAGSACNMSEANLQINYNTAISNVEGLPFGTHIEYMKVIYPFWPAGNCYPVGAAAVMIYSGGVSPLVYDVNGGGLGGKYSGVINGNQVSMYEYYEDVPVATCTDGIQNQGETGIDCGGPCIACPPPPTCTDGIQNQGETGIDCGGPCAACPPPPPPPETCFDGIMNQNETGIDYGGVCGIGGPAPNPGPQPGGFIDNNLDGVDDISGYDVDGNVPIGLPAPAGPGTYDTSLPGELSEAGETDWSTLIIDSLATNPLVVLATGNQINVSGATCQINFELFGKSMLFDFCSLEWMVDLIGTFVLAIMTIRSVFIALGVD